VPGLPRKVRLPKLVQLATPDITGSFWTAWTLKMEAVSSSTSPLTNRHDVIFQKTIYTIRRMGEIRSFRTKKSVGTDCSSLLQRSNKQDNRTTRDNWHVRLQHKPHNSIVYTNIQNCFSFQCVPIVQIDKIFAQSYKTNHMHRLCVTRTK